VSKPYGYVRDKEALVKRLHRIEGQVRGIERMVDDERYCIDILTQIAATTTALESLAFQILEGHVADKSRELLEAVHRFSRTK
jgi:DNA-binding FrmR family transcriptional regulator